MAKTLLSLMIARSLFSFLNVIRWEHLNGDRVEFTFLARRKNHIKEAQVNKILERAKDTFVGRLKVDKDLAYLVTPGDVFAHNIIIPRRKVKGGKTDDKAVVRIIEWPDGENKSPIGEVVDILGQMGDNDVEMNSILAQYGLPYKYPKNVEDAANKISDEITEQDYKEREDFARYSPAPSTRRMPRTLMMPSVSRDWRMVTGR